MFIHYQNAHLSESQTFYEIFSIVRYATLSNSNYGLYFCFTRSVIVGQYITLAAAYYALLYNPIKSSLRIAIPPYQLLIYGLTWHFINSLFWIAMWLY